MPIEAITPSAPVKGTGQPDTRSKITITLDELSERLDRIQAHPDLPPAARTRIAQWTDNHHTALRNAEDKPKQLNKLIQSLQGERLWALGDAEAQPPADRAAEADGLAGDSDEPATDNFDALYGEAAHPETTFQIAAAPTPKRKSGNRQHTLTTLAEKIRGLPTIEDKKAGWIIYPGSFDEGVPTRSLDNIQACTAATFDFDGRKKADGSPGDRVRREDFEEVCREAGVEVITWLTHSAPDDPTDCTFRALMPYKVELAVDLHRPALEAIGKLLGMVPKTILHAGQGFFCQPRPGVEHDVRVTHGRPIDTLVDLHGLEPEEMPAKGYGEAAAAFSGDGATRSLNLGQYADAITMIDAMRAGGHHLSNGARVWDRIGLALCTYEQGEELFLRFSEGAPDFSKRECLKVLDQKRKAVARGDAKAVAGADIANLFRIATAECGIPNPGAGRRRSASEDFAEELAGAGEGRTFITWGNVVQMVKVAWFWKHRLAIGMLHLLGGTPGTGKSTIAFTWAAIISSGGTFPDGVRAPKGKVLIWSGEDSYEATIKPRLVATGADMGNIGFLNQPRALKDGTKVDFNPAEHLPVLMAEIERMPQGEVAMLIIDPIVTMLGNGDNNSTSEVRAALAPLVAMLYKLGIIGLGIIHFTKGSENKDPKDRFSGSAGYIALARVGFAVVKDQNEDGRHLLTVAKSNIGPEGGGYNYHIEQTEVTDPVAGKIETSKVVWGDTLEGDARTLIREAEVVQRDRPANKLQRAKALLRDLLCNGPMLVHNIEHAAEDAGIGWRTMENAKNAVGAVSERSDPDDKRSPYQWLIRIAEFDDEVANAAT